MCGCWTHSDCDRYRIDEISPKGTSENPYREMIGQARAPWLLLWSRSRQRHLRDHVWHGDATTLRELTGLVTSITFSAATGKPSIHQSLRFHNDASRQAMLTLVYQCRSTRGNVCSTRRAHLSRGFTTTLRQANQHAYPTAIGRHRSRQHS